MVADHILAIQQNFTKKVAKKTQICPLSIFFQILLESVLLTGGKIDQVIWPPTHHQQGQKHEKKKKGLKSSLTSHNFYQVQAN